MAQREAGYEDASRKRLVRLGSKPADDSYMARHARTLVADPWQDPYEGFLRARRTGRKNEAKFRTFGPYSQRVQYPNLPKWLAYTIEAPSIGQTVLSAPLRLVFANWNDGPDFQRGAALMAYRYLGQSPDGEHAREVMDWLIDYEQDRKNYIAAIRIVDFVPGYEDKERADLAEQAAAQAYEAANYSRRIDRRNSLLKQVVREWPDTPTGQAAGHQARAEAVGHTPQKIRVTRSFLKENPRVAGDHGLGINPILLNEELDDGELHPAGVAFLGGRHLEIDLIGKTGDEEDPPESVHKVISNERLARVASMLDETSRTNQLIDTDDTLTPDADRDQFLERARLGLANEPDTRPAAQSTYVYKSMRERYGMVRARESILPFDLVFQGTFTDLSLGAFPRWRMPKETPDAFLYR